jgi:hypothetical protein
MHTNDGFSHTTAKGVYMLTLNSINFGMQTVVLHRTDFGISYQSLPQITDNFSIKNNLVLIVINNST